MTGHSEQLLLCAETIGREREIGILDRFLSGAAHPVLVLCGEAGLGKTRLVTAAARAAADRGRQPVVGTCFEPDRAIPFAPLLDLVRRSAAPGGPEALVHRLGPAAADLVRLLPEVSVGLPDPAPPPVTDPAQEKRRIFEALIQLLTRWATEQPVLLVLEDLHWSDDTSLEFLQYAAVRLAAADVRLLITYWSDEAPDSLLHTLAELRRQRLAGEITLGRLNREEIDAMVRSIFRLTAPTPSDLLDFLAATSEGNPFYLEELLQSLVSGGALVAERGTLRGEAPRSLQIPRGVQDTIRRRSDRLSPAARRLLGLAAVAGRRFDFEPLRELAEPDERALLALVKELIAAQLVVEESADRFAFRHALIQQAVYLELLERERRLLHRDIAETLERLYVDVPDHHLADLAHHSYRAGLWSKVLTYSQRLGEQAQTLSAPREAIEHFSQALEAAANLGLPPPASILRARGSAYEMVGDLGGARADLEQAVEAARRSGDQRVEWQCRLALGFFWLANDYQRAGDAFRAAYELAQRLDGPAVLAQSLNRLGNWHLNVEEPGEARLRHEEALAIFRRLDDKSGIAETLDLLAMTNLLAGNLEQCAAAARQATTLFAELGNQQGLISSLATLTFCGGSYATEASPPAGQRPVDFLRDGEPALRLARDIGWRSAEAYLLAVRALVLGPLGEYQPARDLAEQAKATSDEMGHQAWSIFSRCTLAAIALDLLDPTAACREIERARQLAEEIGSLHWIRYSAGLHGSALVALGACDRAESVLDGALDQAAPAQTQGQRRIWTARLQLALTRGDRELTRYSLDRLVTGLESSNKISSVPALLLLQGDALGTLGQLGEAEASLRQAQALAAQRGVRAILWRSHLALARLYRQQARHAETNQALIAARSVIAEIADRLAPVEQRSEFLRRTEPSCQM